MCTAEKKEPIFKLASVLSEFNATLQDNGHKANKKVTCMPLAFVKPHFMWADQIDLGGWLKYLHM